MEAAVKAAASVNGHGPRPIQGLPPGPRMPRALQTAIWSRQAQWFLEQSRARFGPMFTFRIAYEGTWVMVSDPELVKQVFTGDPKVFHAGEGNQILRPVLGDNSVLVLDEKKHISQRKLLLPPFHGERMQAYGEKMTEIAAREIESWPTGVPYKLRPRMQAITLEIIIETVFGVHGGERMGPLREALRSFLDLTTNPRILLPVLAIGPERIVHTRAFRRRVDPVNRLIAAEIADRRAAADLAEREDILSMLVAARHEDGSPMSDAEIRDELLTLLVAGHETTATALAWALERLARHPNTDLTDDAHIDAAVKEVLRTRPVLSITARKTLQPYELHRYTLPPGVYVAACLYLAHRRAGTDFDPARHLTGAPEPYSFIPFGGGTRRCLGAAFATLEMREVLRAVSQRFTLQPDRLQGERMRRRSVTLAPSRGGSIIPLTR